MFYVIGLKKTLRWCLTLRFCLLYARKLRVPFGETRYPYPLTRDELITTLHKPAFKCLFWEMCRETNFDEFISNFDYQNLKILIEVFRYGQTLYFELGITLSSRHFLLGWAVKLKALSLMDNFLISHFWNATLINKRKKTNH